MLWNSTTETRLDGGKEREARREGKRRNHKGKRLKGNKNEEVESGRLWILNGGERELEYARGNTGME